MRTRASGEAAGRLNESRDAHFARPSSAFPVASETFSSKFSAARNFLQQVIGLLASQAYKLM